MAEKIVLTAQKRTVKGKQVGALRRQGILPGIIYGKLGKAHIDPIMIQLNLHDASKIIKLLTGSSLVTVDVEGKEYPVVVREVQKDIIYGTLRHVDFMAVSLTEKTADRRSDRIDRSGACRNDDGRRCRHRYLPS